MIRCYDTNQKGLYCAKNKIDNKISCDDDLKEKALLNGPLTEYNITHFSKLIIINVKLSPILNINTAAKNLQETQHLLIY